MVCCTFAQHRALSKHSEFNRLLSHKVEPLPLDAVKQFFSKHNQNLVTLRGAHETVTDEPWDKFADFFESESIKLPYSPKIMSQLSELIQQEDTTRISRDQIARMLHNVKDVIFSILFPHLQFH